MNLSDTDIAWLAGLLEGEGSFGWRERNNYAWLQLGMTDLDVIRKASNMMDCYMGVVTRRRDDRKIAYQIALHGIKAIIVMRKILPYMGERRTARINEVLSTYKSFTEHKDNFCKRGHDLNIAFSVRHNRDGYRMCKLCDLVLKEKYKQLA